MSRRASCPLHDRIRATCGIGLSKEDQMTRPRPPHGGGNQDEPTEMGRTQNLGHRTQNLGAPTARVKASNFSDQQAESLAWSQEEQAGGQPPQDYGAGGYQQYPQYDQPQYQQPQYNATPIPTAAVRATTRARADRYQDAVRHACHRGRGCRCCPARRRTGLHVDRFQPAGTGSATGTADGGATAGAAGGGAATAPDHRSTSAAADSGAAAGAEGGAAGTNLQGALQQRSP